MAYITHMANVIRPNQIITRSQDGEVTINLNLTITINTDGSLKLDASVAQPQRADKKHIEEEKDQYLVPDFESSELLSNFGEDVGG